MAIPVPIAPGPLTITNDDNTRAESILSAFVQLIASGTAGATITSPALMIGPPNNPAAVPGVVPLLLDTAERQLMMRHIFIALAKLGVVQAEVSSSPSPDKIVKSLGTGLIATGWLPSASLSVLGLTQLSSAPTGASTALNSEEVTATPTASKVPRADGAGHLDPTWLVQDIWGETPSGTVNGSNKVFTTANNFRSGTTRVFTSVPAAGVPGGLRIKNAAGAGNYTETGANQITFGTAPPSSTNILIDYSR